MKYSETTPSGFLASKMLLIYCSIVTFIYLDLSKAFNC